VTPHFHSLVPDGVFVPGEGGVRFEALPPPTQGEVERLLRVVRHRVLRLLEKRGALLAQEPEDALRAYFVLDTGALAPSGVYDDLGDLQREEVLELGPGEYVDRSAWDAEFLGYDDNGDPLTLPTGARVITRRFNGPLLIMAKASTYNTLDSYSGYHATRSAEQFRDDIERLIDRLHRDGNDGKDLMAGE